MDTLLDTRPMPTRLQIESANRMAWRLDRADAQDKAATLFSAMDDTLRALKAMEACGADPAFLHDCAAGLRDQVSNIEHAIHRELENRTGTIDSLEPIDISDLDAFLAKVA